MVDIWWYGQACFKVKGKNASVVFDPYDPDFTGLKPLRVDGDIVCVTHSHQDHNNAAVVKPTDEGQSLSGPVSDAEQSLTRGEDPSPNQRFSGTGGLSRRPFVISGPGEYEISGINVVGVESFHDDSQGAERGKNTIYLANVDDINIVHLGDLGQKKLTQEQVEELSGCDVLMIPVGGVYTIGAREAPDIIAQLEPKIIVPMHYKIDGLKFDLAPLGEFLKVMGKESLEKQAKLSVSRERLPEEVEVAVLETQ